jgi:alpha-mannosidase
MSSEAGLDPKKMTLYMIGNAHLDPVWLWQWQEGFHAAKSTFRSVLDLMRANDDFLFTSSSAAIYEWLERNDPSMFAEIKQRVAEGRWEIAGGWWIQPDCNLPSGESFVRQGLYGQRYFAEHLGVTATVGYNVDSFGHAGSLPQILRKSGLTRYVFMRPQPDEMTLPARLFWWESGDGSRVLAFRIPYEYATWGKGLQQQVRRCTAELSEREVALMCFYGVGNHGGGPTQENLQSIGAMAQDPALPNLVFSTPGCYFEAMETSGRSFPVVSTDLQHHASGCYSAHSGVKRWNRLAENALITAETFSTLAMRITGLPYPDDFSLAWKDVLFNQFHDILAGTSIEPAYEDAEALYGEAMAIAGRNLNHATQSLSWNIGIDPQEGTRPITVFNPHSWPASVPVELELGEISAEDVLIDSTGAELPWQRVQSLATVAGGGRNRICFRPSLPSCGYELFRLLPRPTRKETPTCLSCDTSLENESIRLEVNPLTGNLASLYDKRVAFEYLRGEAARPLVLDDRSDTWSHGVLRFDQVVGEFAVRSLRLVEHGPVKSVIRVESGYGRSRLSQDFSLFVDDPLVGVQVTVDWREQFKMLKLSFPLNLGLKTITYETPYGHIQRPANGEEEPGGAWVDITGIGGDHGDLLGMSFLNDGKYSFSVDPRAFNLTILRSPIYAHHVPYVPEAGREYSFIDQGRQTFTYALLPHTGSWQDAGTVQRAVELNRRPTSLLESFHPGPLPPRESFVSVQPTTVVIAAIKRAEDGDDLILRCFETSGRRTDATIELPRWNRTIRVAFGPSEIKTFRVPANMALAVTETDLIEWNDTELPALGL